MPLKPLLDGQGLFALSTKCFILSRDNTLERVVEYNLRGKQVKMLSMIGGLLLSMCAASAFGQIEMAQKVMPGPHGRPLLISNEWDQLVKPLSVFSNDNLEIFSPDFTTDDWILKNVGGFYDGKKQYAMLLTVFYKNDSNCRRTRIPDGHSNDADFLTSCAQLRYSQMEIEVDDVARTVLVNECAFLNKNGAVGLGLFRAQLRSYPKITLAIKDLNQYSSSLNQVIALASTQIEREMKERAPLLIGLQYPEALPRIIPGYPGKKVYPVMAGVSSPVIISGPKAEFSAEARREHYQGTCLLALVVDEEGNPWNVIVIRPLGKGLDEMALEAVRKYKFKPGMTEEWQGVGPEKTVPAAIGMHIAVKFSYEAEKPTLPATNAPAQHP